MKTNMVNPEIFNPLFHLFNYAIVVIKNFPGNTIEEIKNGVRTICDELEIKPEKINVNLRHNIAYVVTEVENAVKLMEHVKKNKKYQFSILDALVESFSKKHLEIPAAIPFNIVKQGISNLIRNEILRINVKGFNPKTKQSFWSDLINLMKKNSIISFGIIFDEKDTIANIHIEKKNARRLLNLIENYTFNNITLTCIILEAMDTFNPKEWMIKYFKDESEKSVTIEIPTDSPVEIFDDELVLEINSEDFLNNCSDEDLVLEVNNEISLISDSQLLSIEKFTSLESDLSLGKKNNAYNYNPTVLATCRIGRVVHSYASMVRN